MQVFFITILIFLAKTWIQKEDSYETSAIDQQDDRKA